MSKFVTGALLGLSLLAVGCTAGVEGTDPVVEAPTVDGLVIDRLDPASEIDATFTADGTSIRLRALVQGDSVVSTISQNGTTLTRLVVPVGTDRDVGDSLGGLVRAASADSVRGVDYEALAPTYVQAVQALFEETKVLDRSTLRFALMWHEEVIVRIVPNPDAEAASVDMAWDDTIYTLDDDPDMPLHTNFMASPHLRPFRAGGGELRCDLNCSWYDVCCWHDQWCVNCNHWACGPTCVPGCFGGDCGGGR